MPKLTRRASDMLRKNFTGLVLGAMLYSRSFMYEGYLTTERRIRGRRRRGRTRLPATMVSTNQPSWPKASAGTFNVITLIRFPSFNGLNLV